MQVLKISLKWDIGQQWFKKWHWVGETRRPGNYPCQTILHTFKFKDVLESNVVIK